MTKRSYSTAVCPRGAIYGIPMFDVESSNVGRIGYSPEDRALYVQFRNRATETRDGTFYEYQSVPAAVFDALIAADEDPVESVGSTFHRLVKVAGYRYRKMDI